MQMAFVTESLRSACTEEARMKRLWGLDKSDVDVCLGLIGASNTLADLPTLQLCSLVPVIARSGEFESFAVERNAVRVQVKAIDSFGRPQKVLASTLGLSTVRNVLLLAVSSKTKIIGKAVAS